MDFLSFMKGAADTYNSMQQSAARKLQDSLRQKSNQEILAYYKRMDRGKPEFRYVEAEAQRRHLI